MNNLKKFVKLNFKLMFADIKKDRKSKNAWRRYTIKARGMD